MRLLFGLVVHYLISTFLSRSRSRGSTGGSDAAYDYLNRYHPPPKVDPTPHAGGYSTLQHSTARPMSGYIYGHSYSSAAGMPGGGGGMAQGYHPTSTIAGSHHQLDPAVGVGQAGPHPHESVGLRVRRQFQQPES